MIIGIGTDLVEIARVVRACEKDSFLRRFFTVREIECIKSHNQKSASNFAVKEAVVKALGTGFRKIKPADIEVLRDELGAPYVVLYNYAKQLSDEKKIEQWLVTISHTDTLVTATVLAQTSVDLEEYH